jgi:hypothetical protein
VNLNGAHPLKAEIQSDILLIHPTDER